MESSVIGGVWDFYIFIIALAFIAIVIYMLVCLIANCFKWIKNRVKKGAK